MLTLGETLPADSSASSPEGACAEGPIGGSTRVDSCDRVWTFLLFVVDFGTVVVVPLVFDRPATGSGGRLLCSELDLSAIAAAARRVVMGIEGRLRIQIAGGRSWRFSGGKRTKSYVKLHSLL